MQLGYTESGLARDAWNSNRYSRLLCIVIHNLKRSKNVERLEKAVLCGSKKRGEIFQELVKICAKEAAAFKTVRVAFSLPPGLQALVKAVVNIDHPVIFHSEVDV